MNENSNLFDYSKIHLWHLGHYFSNREIFLDATKTVEVDFVYNVGELIEMGMSGDISMAAASDLW